MAEQKINEQKEIVVLTDEVEAVRKLPDMYIGRVQNPGFLNCIREVVQNGLDEIMKGNTNNYNMKVSYDERNHNVIVEDNGQGIVLDKLAIVYSKLHSSSNYDKVEGSGDYSSGKNGAGGCVTNFLSKFFIAESYRMDGTAMRVTFEEGYLKKEQKIKCPKGKHGVIVSFSPSDIMGFIDIKTQVIIDLLYDMVHLCKVGTKLTFNWIDINGRPDHIDIINKNGIYDLLNKVCEKSVITPIHYIRDNGTQKVELLITYDIKNMDDAEVLGYVNTCPTSGGTHIDGMMDGVIKYFRDYMNKIYLANNKKLSVNASDIRTGLRAVVSGFHIKPLFSGQSKEYFSKEDMKPFVTQVTLDALSEWSQNNPGDMQKVCKYLKDVAEIRIKSEGEKIKLTDKYTASVISGLPDKYKKPNGKGPFELILTEGDSAAGGMENNRDKQTQGIYPIRGKISNAFTTPVKKFFENAEISGLLRIMGYNQYNKKFDPLILKPEKIIIATDADPDGAHIESLLMMFFLKYFPFVIQQGKLYGAKPPLYGVETKQGMKFFADNMEYIRYVQDSFCKNSMIKNSYNKGLTKRDITEILYRNMDYVKYVDHVSRLYSIDPLLLEFVLYHREELNDFNKFKKTIERQYKFTKVSKENGTIMIRGLVGSKYQTVFCDQRLLNESKDIINLIDKNYNYLVLNHKKCTMYEFMTTFNTFEPKGITRYKGLGEMAPKLLGESTIIPGMGRTLRQYTIEDVKKEIKYVRDMQSDKALFIKDVGVIRREDIV